MIFLKCYRCGKKLNRKTDSGLEIKEREKLFTPSGMFWSYLEDQNWNNLCKDCADSYRKWFIEGKETVNDGSQEHEESI